MDQLGQTAVGEEIKNTITHTCRHQHTLRTPSGEQVQSWSVTDALRNSSAAIPPVYPGWFRDYSPQHNLQPQIHTHTHTLSRIILHPHMLSWFLIGLMTTQLCKMVKLFPTFYVDKFCFSFIFLSCTLLLNLETTSQ